MASQLINPCNLCFEREGDRQLFLPMFEGKIVDPEVTEDYAYMPACRGCFDLAEQQARQEKIRGRRPATRIESEMVGVIANLQDENRELAERIARITKEVEGLRQYAINRSVMIGECVAWNNLKKLTIDFKQKEQVG